MPLKPVKLDVHTHTLVSGHAFNTIDEMCSEAKERGLELYGITDHAPSIEGSAEEIYYTCYDHIPRNFDGMELLMGCELNVLNEKGDLDLSQHAIDYLDVRIAGVHGHAIRQYKTSGIDYNTETYISLCKNHEIDIISHPDAVDADFEAVCKAAKETNTLLEINNNSVRIQHVRKHAVQNIRQMLEIAKRIDLTVILGSDAHYRSSIADFHCIEPMLDELDFPEELIINYRPDEFKRRLAQNHPVGRRFPC